MVFITKRAETPTKSGNNITTIENGIKVKEKSNKRVPEMVIRERRVKRGQLCCFSSINCGSKHNMPSPQINITRAQVTSLGVEGQNRFRSQNKIKVCTNNKKEQQEERREGAGGVY